MTSATEDRSPLTRKIRPSLVARKRLWTSGNPTNQFYTSDRKQFGVIKSLTTNKSPAKADREGAKSRADTNLHDARSLVRGCNRLLIITI